MIAKLSKPSPRIAVYQLVATIAYIEYSVLLVPLILASLALPFGLWDYLTAPNIYLPDKSFTFLSVIGNYFHNIFYLTPTVRPTTTLLLNIEYWLFGGQFWLWYVVRWAAKIGGAFLLTRILMRFRVDPYARLAIFGFWLFFPPASDLMLISADGWIATVAIGLMAVLLTWNAPDTMFDLRNLSVGRYTVVLLLWFLLLGTKEVGFVLAGCAALMMVAALIRHNRPAFDAHALSRWPVFWVLLGLWVWKLTAALRAFPSGNVPSGTTARIHWSTLLGHITYLGAGIPFHVAPWLLGIGAVWYIWRLQRAALERPFLIFLGMSLIGCLAFVSITINPAPRYVVPAGCMLALLFGFALHDMTRVARWAVAGLAIVFPILGAGDLYNQMLAYQQYFYESADILSFVDQSVAQGYTPVLTGDDRDIPLENQHTIALYFEKYGRQFYGRSKALAVVDLSASPAVSAEKIALICHLAPPAALNGAYSALRQFRIDRGYQIQRGHYGVIEKLALHLGTLDRRLHSQAFPSYDLGAPVVTAEPYFYIYLMNREPSLPGGDPGNGRPLQALWNNFTKRISSQQSFVGNHAYTYRAAPGDSVKLSIRLQSGLSVARLSYSGAIKVDAGDFIFGVSDGSGKDLWNVRLSDAKTWTPLPQAPVLHFDPATQYHLFVYGHGTTAGEFSIKDLRLDDTVNVMTLPGMRRFGAAAE